MDTRRSTKTEGKLYEGRGKIIRRRREDYMKTVRRRKKDDTETEGRRDEDEENRGAYWREAESRDPDKAMQRNKARGTAQR